ncbi:isochorismatase family protein [Helicobacter sp.]|uniref:isochorismatase family protein n=1 Tax=Helicobacter sp. TaxID=218 RepID=UPI002583278C|nr:isochorismatase family protein [Helicobacter sp.]MCI7047940.1 isochorismatase family protein [Helicobacter sp.]
MPSYTLKQKASFAKEGCVFVCVDIQEKLFGVMQNQEKLLKNANNLLRCAEAFCQNALVLEQYPKGLGKAIVSHSSQIIQKNSFSAFGEETFCRALEKCNAQTLILFGIESHICVRETALDSLKRDFEVFIIEDACSARDAHNHALAMQELRDLGARIISTESALFSFLLHSKEENFKTISALVKE